LNSGITPASAESRFQCPAGKVEAAPYDDSIDTPIGNKDDNHTL